MSYSALLQLKPDWPPRWPNPLLAIYGHPFLPHVGFNIVHSSVGFLFCYGDRSITINLLILCM